MCDVDQAIPGMATEVPAAAGRFFAELFQTTFERQVKYSDGIRGSFERKYIPAVLNQDVFDMHSSSFQVHSGHYCTIGGSLTFLNSSPSNAIKIFRTNLHEMP